MSRRQYLLRFDDICPTMNWRVWSEIEDVLVQRQLKPILAVVPDNRDPGLQVDAPVVDFWDRVRTWQDWGWTMALHGYQHRYVSRNAGMVAVRKKSEFAGLPEGEQWDKLRRGVEIFESEGIKPRVWIAPGNTFDATTVSLLPEFGIRIICDGYFRFPFVAQHPASNGERFSQRDSRVEPENRPFTPTRSPSEGEKVSAGQMGETSDGTLYNETNWMTWIPSQLFYFRPAPAGVWTVCYHHNNWTASQLQKFREDVDDYVANIASLEEVLEKNAPCERKWSEWLCLHPRLSRFLIRAELKLWEVTGSGQRATREAEVELASPVTRHPSR